MLRIRSWLLAALSLFVLPGGATAVTIATENFEGYSLFLTCDPLLPCDLVNPGLPKASEGANAKWYGIRFDTKLFDSNAALDGDLAVQKIGGGANNSHVGRFSDDAGIALHLSTSGQTGVTLSFDWRTFLASSSDRLRVGFFSGAISPLASSDYLMAGSSSSPYRWTQWTQLMAGTSSDSWKNASFALPSNSADLWVVFWMDGGGSHFGKIDNVSISASAVPEPGTLALLGFGLFGLGAAGRRRS